MIESEDEVNESEKTERTEEEKSEGKRKRKAFEDVRHDAKKAKSAKRLIDNEITIWNKLYYGEPLGNEETGKSKVVMKEIAKQVEWMLPNLTEPFTSTSHPVDCSMGREQTKARKIKRYLNTHFTSDFDRDTILEQ